MADTPTPVPTPTPAPTPAPASTPALEPLKSWSHPLGDRSNPLEQLTNLAEATGGYYPLGRNGFWHGGIHFDAGTDAKTDPTHVRCIADGEVVAYRFDSRYPQSTLYNAANVAFQAPFATGFVLVRHRLRAPAITGSEVAPPELTFYSLYMHLKHWAAYQEDESIARPAFWPQGTEMRVKKTVNDTFVGKPSIRGLNVRSRADHSAAHPAPVIDLLERGTKVTISGEGAFRKLEGSPGPASLMGEDGALRGYLSFQHLAPIAGDLYRVNSNGPLNVRAEPNSNAGTAVIGKLPKGAEVTISGEGDFRKLEGVNQYIHFASLEGQREPQARDAVVVLATPAGIKAGELIGHIGDTQESDDAPQQHRLHVEVFSGQNVETFIRDSRNWAKDLPESGKTWLKFAKGTPVVAHQDSFDASHPPSPTAAATPSGTDLLLPKSLLNGLRAEFKIKVPATGSEKARNWYRLEGLFNTAEFTQLNGWVCEEVGVTPWVSPWAWEGYELIYNEASMRASLAYSLCAEGELDAMELERYHPLVLRKERGPLQQRLYDLIPDKNADGRLTANELQAGLRQPAVAQSISQLIIHYESEWHYEAREWDALDDLMGHSGSMPNPNWVASKERMRKLGWWNEVAASLGLPESGEVYHFHPVGLAGAFLRIFNWVIGKTSEHYESGGRGPGVISTGSGDHGGVSYGRYQFSSNMGVVQKYIAASKYSAEFAGLAPATPAFNQKWREIASEHADEFSDEQHDFIKLTHYDEQMKVLRDNGLGLSNGRAALQDLIWSTSVQYGPKTKLIVRALAGLDVGSMTDRDIIIKVQDYKYLNVEAHFFSSPNWWNDLKARAAGEKQKLLMLEAENRVVDI